MKKYSNESWFTLNVDLLSRTVTRTRRRTARGRAKAARDIVTQGFIAAGMRLIRRALGPGAVAPRARGADDDGPDRPMLLDWLSQRKVAEEFANNPSPLPSHGGSAAALRRLWEPHSNFIADLLSFGLSSEHYVGKYKETIDELARQLITGTSFVEAAHELCYWDLRTVASMPTMRLQLIASVVAEQDEVISTALADNYRGVADQWRGVYQAALAAVGLRLRSNVSLDDLYHLFSALAEGFALRIIAEPDAPVIDHEHHRSLYGTGCLAILASLTEPVENEEKVAFEEFAQTLFRLKNARPEEPGS